MTVIPRRLFAATHNRDKLREIRSILKDTGWKIVGVDDLPPYPEPDETGATLAANALLKARHGFHRSGLLTLADDSGLEVEALGGRPDVHSARYAGANCTYADNVRKLLAEMKDVPIGRRAARFRCVMALVGPDLETWTEGIVNGCITTSPHGSNGFGYDPVFYANELGKTFAEAWPEEKHSISHRRRALEGIITILKTLKIT